MRWVNEKWIISIFEYLECFNVKMFKMNEVNEWNIN